MRKRFLDLLADAVYALYERAVRNKTIAVGVVNVTEPDE